MPRKTKKQSKSKNPIQKMAKKAAVPQKLKAINKKASRIEPETIAKGAATVSIAAGVIAAGAMLADQKNRQKAGRVAAKGIEFVKEVVADMGEEVQGRYQTVAQNIPTKGSSKQSFSTSKKQSNKGRSKK